ncbi:MAG: hypothetical protein ACREMH_01885 [Gemmatimonadales bacterium]
MTRSLLTRLAAATAVMALPAMELSAQAPDPAPSRAAIERLKFMEGTWRGTAWMMRGNERTQTDMVEIVERKLGGTVLLVQGLGTVADPGAATRRTVHDALAVISFDPRSGAYGMRSYLGSGQFGDFTLTLVDGGVTWTREVPGGRIRNTARYTADEWHEIGEFSRDDTTWTQVMEIKLRRES